MSNTTILLKGPDRGNVSTYTPPASVSLLPIPSNISQAINTTLDMRRYIVDTDNQRTSTAVYVNGNPLPVPWFISYDPATELLSFDNVGQAQNLTFEVCTGETLMELPLLTASQFEYLGSFNTPTSTGFRTYQKNVSLAYSGNDTLFIFGHDTGDTSNELVGEISIPTLKTSDYETASVVQAFVTACGGKQTQVETGKLPNNICGMTVHNNRLIIHVGAMYYDDLQTVSTFARSTTLTDATVHGPCRIGDAGFQQRYIVGGSMTLPDIWRTEFGGYPSICGGGGGLSRSDNYSNGPAFVFYDPDQVIGTNAVTATPATYYPDPNNPGTYNPGELTDFFTGASTHRSTFVVDGYRTVVAFGRHGDYYYTQNGNADELVDRFWLYDAADVKDAFDGTVANDAPISYATADMRVSYSGYTAPMSTSNRGGTFDPDNNIFYIIEANGNGSYPRIHAIRINV